MAKSVSFSKLIATKISSNFREATSIIPATINVSDLKPGHVLVKSCFAGINASDVNFTAGIYQPDVKPPFDCGFEGIGIVEHAPDGVPLQRGTAVAYARFGAFAEYLTVPAHTLFPLPSADPKYLPLLVSGLTASIALEKVGDLKQAGGETVLITAAAGGTGQFAVQLASRAGNHVIGTCSSEEKAAFLRSIGCHRVINYKTEDLHAVLRAEYPKGVDLVYECVGGDMLQTSMRNLATRGRIVLVGMVSGYTDGSAWQKDPLQFGRLPIGARLLQRSQSLRGFFLNDFADCWAEHLFKLTQMVDDGSIVSHVDNTPFVGLEGVANAVEYMYAGRNQGKVVVQLDASPKSKL